ncbi:glycerophosphodiester phosphodiesterase [Halobacteriales archaeon Cl-PHB]
MRCIAHRGFAADAPENTLTAVRRAADRGAVAVEVDLRTAADGEVVVIHDETVDRVTDAAGPVDSFTATELAALSVLDSGEGIPSLSGLLETVPSDLDLVLECKETGLAEPVAAAAERVPNRVTVSSFHPAALAELGAISRVDRALLAPDAKVEVVERAVDLGCAVVHVGHESCDAAFVAEAHDAGLEVAAWTVETRAEAWRLDAAGVDGLIADTAACCGFVDT